ncbi:RlpA-like double-psi beta-barrel-protein domain-containing protein-containing protein [Phycomyces nitens]|nr:RlpA-like double-psi beta-barrel-protein domain-containing protein-containing protein [Phycomyces nitens]
MPSTIDIQSDAGLDSNSNRQFITNEKKPYRIIGGSFDSLPPDTLWTRLINKYRYGRLGLIALGIIGVLVVMFIILGTLDVFKNELYRTRLGLPSIGKTKYKGSSSGTATEGDFNISGQGDGTYYDPGVGYTACGTQFTAQDYVAALNHVDYGVYENPNESPVCGACIKVTGELGTVKVTIQDMCPGCERGSLDLSPAAFSKIDDISKGRVPVSWTPC